MERISSSMNNQFFNTNELISLIKEQYKNIKDLANFERNVKRFPIVIQIPAGPKII